LSSAFAGAQTTTTGQTITIVTNSQSTQLVDSQLNSVNRSYVPDHPFWVNRGECEADWQYQIGVSSTGINGLPFEVWATNGGDCSTVGARLQPTTATCWKVYSQSSFTQGTSGTTNIYISARTLLGGHKYVAGTTDTISVIPGVKDDCNPMKRVDTVPSTGVALTVYFFAFGNGTSGTPTATATWTDAGYDLLGPTPPSSVSVASADTQLYVNWSQVLDSDLAGYHIYCKLPNGSQSDAGTSLIDTSVDGGLVDSQCLDDQVWPNLLPPTDLPLSGRVDGITATSGLASGLENGKRYACAVAAFDTRQNDGRLSMVKCGEPWWVNDFYTKYRGSQGKGGGGFCSIGQRGSGFGLLIPLASLCLLALRRWRSSTQESKAPHDARMGHSTEHHER
jgi:hypothetical protein